MWAEPRHFLHMASLPLSAAIVAQSRVGVLLFDRERRRLHV